MGSVIEIAEAVRAGRVTALSVLEEHIARIEQANLRINAFAFLDFETAIETARTIDRRVAAGENPGPLAGVPLAVKDMEDCAGMPTRNGTLLVEDDTPKQNDSIQVARLRAAGAVPVGKTTTAEYGMDSATNTKACGVTRNPWNLDLTPGGSSGGSAAAVAAGVVPLGTGTDAGGSIRQPAAYTGIVGLKPSHARIPKEGGFANWSTRGALTRDVLSTARFLDVAAGPDDRDRQSLPAFAGSFEQAADHLDVSGLRAVYSPDIGFAIVQPEVESLARAAAEKLISTAGLNEVRMPVRLTNIYDAWGGIMLGPLHEQWTKAGIWPAKAELMSDQVRMMMHRIEDHGEIDYASSWERIYQLERDMAELFRSTDILLTPATACRPHGADSTIPTELNGHDITSIGVEPFGVFVNACWNPAISIPAGMTEDGLPVGLQITCRRHRDDVTLRLARMFEQVQPWDFPPGYY
jgi:aspartyl-tRNA(Asn)/glutamyl-tRNA(Gln) amidotransferase subunit A